LREGAMSGERVEAFSIIEELRGLCLGNQHGKTSALDVATFGWIERCRPASARS
jgi:hypothetical protein